MSSADLPITSYALLGLLTFGDAELTGYELKQRADATLRFYWTAPAMSQIYSELTRLESQGLVLVSGEGRGRRYRISAGGRRAVHRWMAQAPVPFPVWKHHVALRLVVGHLAEPDRLREILRDYIDELEDTAADLRGVRESLQGADAPGQDLRYPSLVADWGLAHFASEAEIARSVLDRLDEQPEQ